MFYVHYLHEGYCYLSRKTRSPVCLWTRGLGVGDAVECTLDSSAETDSRTAEEYIRPLFEGEDGLDGGWIRTTRKAVLEVIGRDQDDWFARLTQRGLLEAHQSAHRPDTDWLRVLYDPRQVASGLRVTSTPGFTVQAFGSITERVATDIRNHRQSLLRGSDDGRLIAREYQLFRLLSLGSPSRVLRPLARISVPHYKAAALYGRSLAVPGDHEAAAEWLVKERLRFAFALLDMHNMVLAAGWGLGCYHVAAFGIRVRLADNRTAKPELTLLHAPFAARLGEAYNPADVELGDIDYPTLRFRGVPDVVLQGRPATMESEQQAFALAALDLIVQASEDPGRTTGSVTESLDRLRTHDHEGLEDLVEGLVGIARGDTFKADFSPWFREALEKGTT